MSAPPTPLPELTPQDAARLDALIAADLCLLTLAATTQTPIYDLIRWADSPSIAPWITRLRALRAAKLRQEMLAHLQSLVRTTPDPIESRRAATAALKHLSGARPKPRPAPIETRGSDPSAGCHWSPAARGRATSANRPPAPALSASERTAPASENNPTPHHSHSGCHWSAAARGRATSADGATTPTPPPPAIPAPTVLPDPTLTPRQVATHLISTPTTPGLTHTAALPVGTTRPDKAAHRLTLPLDSRQDAAPPHARRLADLTLTPYIRASG